MAKKSDAEKARDEQVEVGRETARQSTEPKYPAPEGVPVQPDESADQPAEPVYVHLEAEKAEGGK